MTLREITLFFSSFNEKSSNYHKFVNKTRQDKTRFILSRPIGTASSNQDPDS